MKARKAWKTRVHDAELERLWKNPNLTQAEIAELMGFVEMVISYRAKMLDLPPRLRGRPKNEERNKEICRRLDSGASVEAVAVAYGLSPKTVYNIRHESRVGKKE